MSVIDVHDADGESVRNVLIGDYQLPAFYDAATVKNYFENVPKCKCRSDDVMLLSFPKTGTNWLYEIISMILHQTSNRLQTGKDDTMLEYVSMETLDAAPSPRLLNTHLNYRYLPVDMISKGVKAILIVRNPKDTVVSHYNHTTGIRIYNYNGHWNNYLPLWQQGKLEYGKYSDYILEYERAMAEGFPVHVVHYEDMKLDGENELDKLAAYLEVTLDKSLKQDILEMCSFTQMAKDKIPENVVKRAFKDGFYFYRKGEVGDWKNWFTVSQNDDFDLAWHKAMTDSNIKFTYDSK